MQAAFSRTPTVAIITCRTKAIDLSHRIAVTRLPRGPTCYNIHQGLSLNNDLLASPVTRRHQVLMLGPRCETKLFLLSVIWWMECSASIVCFSGFAVRLSCKQDGDHVAFATRLWQRLRRVYDAVVWSRKRTSMQMAADCCLLLVQHGVSGAVRDTVSFSKNCV